MESRRASVVSGASLRQRKYSTDRALRQAELSARLEEGRPLILQPLQISEDPHEDAAEKLDQHGIKSLTRADTSVSPFDFHPGQRVDDYHLAAAAGINTGFEFGSFKPWPEPTAAQQEDIERRAAVVQRSATTSLDFTPAQVQFQRNLTRSISHAPRRRWLPWRSKIPYVAPPSASDGLHIAAAMHAALGLRFVAQKSPDWLKRQQMHVMEYKINPLKAFPCDLNVAFDDMGALKHHLSKAGSKPSDFSDGSAVRLIHIRNNIEAFKYMDQSFAISSAEIHYGERGFKQWMQEDRDSKRASNMTIRWRPGFDTHRQVICMALGIDLGAPDIFVEHSDVKRRNPSQKSQSRPKKRRVAVYIQRSLSAATPNARVTQFNSRGRVFEDFAKQDNVVICEYSSDAWSEISNTPSLLALSPVAGLPQNSSAAVMASVTSHLFWEIVSKWESQIAAIHQPFADLEERVHSQPSDISHSNQVWEWSRYLRNLLKLAVRHLKAIQTFQEDFALFAEIEEVEWLDDVLVELKHIADTIRIDYIEPLEHMIDLMYKSVTIRDSRLSLELSASLWRLSWITFIFLPLTFLVGFFGMNVDLFQKYPSIKWYFVGLVPLTGFVAGFWFAFNSYRLEPKMYKEGDITRASKRTIWLQNQAAD